MTAYAKDQPASFSNRIEHVAIIGAGGKLGQHLTWALLATGKHTVTAITRPESTSQLPEGVKVKHVDYGGEDSEVLVQALRGQQILIITMAVTAPRDTVSKLVRAASQAGVRYVMPNWFGHDPQNRKLCEDSMLAQRDDQIRAEVESLGNISYMQLVCNFWYEFSLGGGPNRFGFDFRKRSLVLFDDASVPISVTTWPQCGKSVAGLLSLKELPEDEFDESPTLSQFRNAPIYVSSFLLTQLDMFESVKRVTNTSNDDWNITYESAEQRWKSSYGEVSHGNFGAFTKMLYSRMFFPNGGGDYESHRNLDNRLLGLPVENLDEATATGILMGENNEVPYSH